MPEISEDHWYIKNRYLFGIMILSFIISVFFSMWIEQDVEYPLSEIIFDYIFDLVLVLCLFVLAKKAEVNRGLLLGKMSSEFFTAKYISIVFPLLALSAGAIFLTYLPLSFIIPDFVQAVLLDDETKMLWVEGPNYKLANALSFTSVVIIAPVLEEIFFRGFLLTSLAKKIKLINAVIVSSLVFGLLHADLLGAGIFGVVLSFLYLKTRSLYLPIIIHYINNAITFIVYYLFYKYENGTKYTLDDFQGDWWIGIIGLIIGISWFIYFFRREISGKTFNIPYFVKT